MWFFALITILNFCFNLLLAKDFIECGACKLIIEELESEISKVDPKKKIQVGSFRVDPKGNQFLNDVPYARSEVHINEIMEKICDKSSMYGVSDHPVTKKQTILKMHHVDGTRRPMMIDISNSIKHKLKSACENILEEHEDEIVKLLNKERENPIERFCLYEKDYCETDDLVPFPIETEPPSDSNLGHGSDQTGSDEL